MMQAQPIVQVCWKDEGDFGFIVTYTQADLDVRATGKIGVPYDPNRVRNYGTLAEAMALAQEHNAQLVLT